MIKRVIFVLENGQTVEVPLGAIKEIERTSMFDGRQEFKVTFYIDDISLISQEIPTKQIEDGNTITGTVVG